jgi:hypothetical protein
MTSRVSAHLVIQTLVKQKKLCPIEIGWPELFSLGTFLMQKRGFRETYCCWGLHAFIRVQVLMLNVQAGSCSQFGTTKCESGTSLEESGTTNS